MRTDPSGLRVPSRSEKRISERASRRAMLSAEKLSMRCVKSSVRCTRICSSATARRGRFMTISSISGVLQAISLVSSSAVGLFGTVRQAEERRFAEEFVRLVDVHHHLVAVVRQADHFHLAVDHQIQAGGGLILVVNGLALAVLHNGRARQMRQGDLQAICAARTP